MRGEREKYEQHAEREDEHDGVAGQNLLVGQVRPFVAHTGRQFFRGQLLGQSDGLAGTHAGHGHTVDVRGGIHVVADDFVRACGFMDLHERAKWYHVAGGVAGF